MAGQFDGEHLAPVALGRGGGGSSKSTSISSTRGESAAAAYISSRVAEVLPGEGQRVRRLHPRPDPARSLSPTRRASAAPDGSPTTEDLVVIAPALEGVEALCAWKPHGSTLGGPQPVTEVRDPKASWWPTRCDAQGAKPRPLSRGARADGRVDGRHHARRLLARHAGHAPRGRSGDG